MSIRIPTVLLFPVSCFATWRLASEISSALRARRYLKHLRFSDCVDLFISDVCEIRPEGFALTGALEAEYRNWRAICGARGSLASDDLFGALKRRGFIAGRRAVNGVMKLTIEGIEIRKDWSLKA